MTIRNRLILAFLAVSIIPLAAVGYTSLQAMESTSSLTLDESTTALQRLGEDAIHQKALAVAREVDLYLEAHPEVLDLPPQELEANPALAAIAVQVVGETGYTAVYERSGLVHFHANPEIVGAYMQDLASSLPQFWAIFERSLDGTQAAGYYAWQEADGTIRQKYMSCVPVSDTFLRVAATTYIDEFYRPIRETETKIALASQQARQRLLAALIAVGCLALGLALWLAWGISRPVNRLAAAAAELEQGAYQPETLAAEMARRDDLGKLARVFDRMAGEVRAREARLHLQIEELIIQIDQAKRSHQVAKITETEYFQQLQSKARKLRRRTETDDE